MSPTPSPGSKVPGADRVRAANVNAAAEGRSLWVVAVAAWLVPGAGHVLAGQMRKATIFFGVLMLMFVVGLAFEGRLFPFETAEPLVFLAAGAEWALLVPRLVASAMHLGQGRVVAVTYEYGNTFLIVCGLLNALVVLDAIDRARGVKRS